jgi:hypothetical protein
LRKHRTANERDLLHQSGAEEREPRDQRASEVKIEAESISKTSQEAPSPTTTQANVGAPVAHIQFTVPATKDIASRVAFHFSGFGYRIVEERPNHWIFGRGKTLAALWESDIRMLKTTLAVRMIIGDDDRAWVSCHWSVRTLGLSAVRRRDVAMLEAEGRELQVMLGGDAAGSFGRDEHASLRSERCGTLGRAWDDWWAERDRRFTRLVQTVLLLFFVACLWVWVGFSTKSNLASAKDGERLRETTFEFGVQGSPWFQFHMNPAGQPGWNWGIHWISWSSAIMLIGFLAWCVSWQIEKTQAKTNGERLRWWHGSPNLAIVIWLVATILALALGHSPLFMEQMERKKSRANSESIEKESDHGTQTTPNTICGEQSFPSPFCRPASMPTSRFCVPRFASLECALEIGKGRIGLVSTGTEKCAQSAL